VVLPGFADKWIKAMESFSEERDRQTAKINPMNDPIVDEVRKVRDAHAARFNYDLDAIVRDIKEQEKKSERTFVSLVPEQPGPIQALQPNGATLPITREEHPIRA
jgi:hypothetical protein